MNRLWWLLGLLVLVGAVVFGLLSAGNQTRLDTALILADVTMPGCDAPGQVHLVLGNAGDRPIGRVEGVLSVAATDAEPISTLQGQSAPARGSKPACRSMKASSPGKTASRSLGLPAPL